MVLIPNKKVFQIFLSLPRPLTLVGGGVSVIKFFSPAVPRSHAAAVCVFVRNVKSQEAEEEAALFLPLSSFISL